MNAIHPPLEDDVNDSCQTRNATRKRRGGVTMSYYSSKKAASMVVLALLCCTQVISNLPFADAAAPPIFSSQSGPSLLDHLNSDSNNGNSTDPPSKSKTTTPFSGLHATMRQELHNAQQGSHPEPPVRLVHRWRIARDQDHVSLQSAAATQSRRPDPPGRQPPRQQQQEVSPPHVEKSEPDQSTTLSSPEPLVETRNDTLSDISPPASSFNLWTQTKAWFKRNKESLPPKESNDEEVASLEPTRCHGSSSESLDDQNHRELDIPPPPPSREPYRLGWGPPPRPHNEESATKEESQEKESSAQSSVSLPRKTSWFGRPLPPRDEEEATDTASLTTETDTASLTTETEPATESEEEKDDETTKTLPRKPFWGWFGRSRDEETDTASSTTEIEPATESEEDKDQDIDEALSQKTFWSWFETSPSSREREVDEPVSSEPETNEIAKGVTQDETSLPRKLLFEEENVGSAAAHESPTTNEPSTQLEGNSAMSEKGKLETTAREERSTASTADWTQESSALLDSVAEAVLSPNDLETENVESPVFSRRNDWSEKSAAHLSETPLLDEQETFRQRVEEYTQQQQQKDDAAVENEKLEEETANQDYELRTNEDSRMSRESGAMDDQDFLAEDEEVEDDEEDDYISRRGNFEDEEYYDDDEEELLEEELSEEDEQEDTVRFDSNVKDNTSSKRPSSIETFDWKAKEDGDEEEVIDLDAMENEDRAAVKKRESFVEEREDIIEEEESVDENSHEDEGTNLGTIVDADIDEYDNEEAEVDTGMEIEIKAKTDTIVEEEVVDEYNEIVSDFEEEYGDEDDEDEILLALDDPKVTLEDWIGSSRVFSFAKGRRKPWSFHTTGRAVASNPILSSAIFWTAQRHDDQFQSRLSNHLVEIHTREEQKRQERLAQAVAARQEKQRQRELEQRQKPLQLRLRPVPMLAKLDLTETEDGPDLTDEEFELLLHQLETEPIFEPISNDEEEEEKEGDEEEDNEELESLQSPVKPIELPQILLKKSFLFQSSHVVSDLCLLDLTDHFDSSDERLLLEAEDHLTRRITRGGSSSTKGGELAEDERLNEGDVWILVESNEVSRTDPDDD